MDDEFPVFPAKVFLFDAAGYHAGPYKTLKDEDELKILMTDETFLAHFKSGLEIRITDPGDSCVFHANGGKIIFM